VGEGVGRLDSLAFESKDITRWQCFGIDERCVAFLANRGMSPPYAPRPMLGVPVRGFARHTLPLCAAHPHARACLTRADLERIDEARSALDGAISAPQLSGAPLLVLANKQDKPGAVGADQVGWLSGDG